MGMGRYQWCIFFLCGFGKVLYPEDIGIILTQRQGYFLDLCWAQAFGLVATPIRLELGIAGGHRMSRHASQRRR